MKKYFKITDMSPIDTPLDKIYYNLINSENSLYKNESYLDGESYLSRDGKGLRYISLINGAKVYISGTYKMAYNQDPYRQAENPDFHSFLFTLIIDTNGDDSPNVMGRDLFVYNLTNKGKLEPFGSQKGKVLTSSSDWKNDDYSYGCANLQNATGTGCAGRIEEEGWQMNY